VFRKIQIKLESEEESEEKSKTRHLERSKRVRFGTETFFPFDCSLIGEAVDQDSLTTVVVSDTTEIEELIENVCQSKRYLPATDAQTIDQ